MINWFLSIMVHKGLLEIEEAEHLAKELVTRTHPSGFRDAHAVIEKLLKDFQKNQ